MILNKVLFGTQIMRQDYPLIPNKDPKKGNTILGLIHTHKRSKHF